MDTQFEKNTSQTEEIVSNSTIMEPAELEKKRLEAQHFSNMANQLLNQKKFSDSFDYYLKSKTSFEKISDKEGVAFQLKQMGYIKEITGEFPASLDYYRECKKTFKELENKSEFSEVADRIAKTLFKDRKYSEAISEYNEAIDFGCRNSDTFNNAGFIHITVNDLENAKSALKTAYEIRSAENSEFLDITLNNLGTAAYLEKDYENALKYFSLALEANKRKTKDDRTIEFIVFASNDLKSDEMPLFECYNDVLTKAAEHLNIAAAHAMLNNKEMAIQNCETAHSVDSDKSYLFLPSAWIYLSIGNKEKALGYFKRVLSFDPANKKIREIVEKINPYVFEKVGRNEPCPCKSGKKFKKCHGLGL